VVTDPQTNKQNPQTNPQTGPIKIHCAAASAQCNEFLNVSDFIIIIIIVIYLLIKVYKKNTKATRQVKPSRTARLTGALSAAHKTIKTL